MARKTLPAHLRKSGPGTGGRNVERDKKICALKATTELSNEAIGKQFNVSRETVRHVLVIAERNARLGRTGWVSAAERRAEAREWLDR